MFNIKKITIIVCFTVFCYCYAYAETSLLRFSVLGNMFAGEGESSIYEAFPPHVDTVAGLDVGVLGTKVQNVYGLQFSVICISSFAAGVQFAGVFSETQKLWGLQSAGLIAVAKNGMSGIQAGGLAAVTTDGAFNGIQLAGFGCVNTVRFNGVQAAILIAYSEKITGLQAGGLVSKVNGSLSGIQLSLLWAYTESGNGLQFGAAGGGSLDGISIIGIRTNSVQKYTSRGAVISVLSIGKRFSGEFYEVQGFQASGVNLFTGKTKGVQAGIVNIAEEVKGVQIGAVNYASKLSGIQIGFVNIAANAKIPVLPILNVTFK